MTNWNTVVHYYRFDLSSRLSLSRSFELFVNLTVFEFVEVQEHLVTRIIKERYKIPTLVNRWDHPALLSNWQH